jgi:SH3 domain protein
MRHALVLGILLFVLPATLSAETRYVSEVREITLRTGPGSEYKITAMIKSGTPMTILDELEDWTRIQLGNGKDGWVLTQFLQTKVPDAILLENLQKKYTALSGEADTLRSQNRELNDKMDTLTSSLEACRNEHTSLNTTYETLRNESSDFLSLQEKFKATSKELEDQKEKSAKLEKDLSEITNDKRLWWIIAGAGILIIGIFFGFALKPQRRRSSLL